MKTFGERLRELREDNDKSQKAIGEILGCSQRCYAGYELQTRGVPMEVLCKLADYYGVSTDYLLGRTDNPKPYPQGGHHK